MSRMGKIWRFKFKEESKIYSALTYEKEKERWGIEQHTEYRHARKIKKRGFKDQKVTKIQLEREIHNRSVFLSAMKNTLPITNHNFLIHVHYIPIIKTNSLKWSPVSPSMKFKLTIRNKREARNTIKETRLTNTNQKNKDTQKVINQLTKMEINKWAKGKKNK